MPIDYQKLQKVLVESELLTKDQLNMAQEKSHSTNLPLEKILSEYEFLSGEHLGQVIADIFEVPFVNLKKKSIEDGVLRIIPELVAKKQNIISFDRDQGGIKVAMFDPGDEEIIQFIQKKTGEQVVRYFAMSNDISEALAHYNRGLKEEFDDIIKQNIEAARQKTGEDLELP
ncbi:hypothetical protein KKF61_00050, partial [Patescibacteria group bacterium]|nr:hypothetical protein [Patescibacteria group bacterium]